VPATREPPKNNRLEDLHPDFRAKLERWLAQARATFPQFHIRVGETRRTAERQAWLYASGRSRPGPILTYTLNSNHRWGLAADLVIVRRRTPWRAEWDWRVWRAVYKAVPPELYGLRTLDFEMVHLEADNAAKLLQYPEVHGLYQT
jgi:peptidoglycan L-alanyl-D-glutamate endopeptidase CwlK